MSDVAAELGSSPVVEANTSTARRTRSRTGRTPGSSTTTRSSSTRPRCLPGRLLDLGRLRRGARADHRAQGGRSPAPRHLPARLAVDACRASRSHRLPAPTCRRQLRLPEALLHRARWTCRRRRAARGLGTVTTNKLTYQAQFGKQRAAMMPMGTWYIGDPAHPAEERRRRQVRVGHRAGAAARTRRPPARDNTPVTFADPTGLGINAESRGRRSTTAKAFLAYAAGPAGGQGARRASASPRTH